MIDFATIVNALEPLTIVYSVFAACYMLMRVGFALRKKPRMEVYILSDSEGHTVTISWAAEALPEERARVMNEKVHSLEAKTA